MSLYNLLFGTNPFSNVLLQMLGVSRDDVPRFRDCFLNEEGTEIIIHTRTGGGNRDEYESENDALTLIGGYKFDADDDFDCTYADFHYAVPEACKSQVALMKDLGAVTNPAERWQEVLDGLRSGDTSKPDVARAIAVGEQLMGQIKKHIDGEKQP
jgi:hypothetical protein